MSKLLATPTMAVYTVERRTWPKGPKWSVRLHSYHFGTTSAVQAAVRLRTAGQRGAFIAGSKRAILPGVVRWR